MALKLKGIMKKLKTDYDYVIIGSGFGGSVSALRLSEKGYKVLIIEKGKWYNQNDFPKTNWNIKKWLWLPWLKCFGIMKLSFFRHITFVSVVGGGSLVYANTLPIPKSNFFNTGSWANLDKWEDVLKPYYKIALKMLGAIQNPILFDADLALLEVAKKIGKEDHFSPTNVGVYFDEPNKKHNDPYFSGEGPERAACNFCGGCLTGCPNNSKNSLDKNYLYFAQKNGVKIIPKQEVVDVIPILNQDGSDGYEVHYSDSLKMFKRTKKVITKGVVFSGGVSGTIKLLLKLKNSTLPNLSDKVGYDIRTNNETLISISTLEKEKDFSRGVAVGSILHIDEDTHVKVFRYAKGSDAWKLAHLPYSPSKKALIRYFNVFTSFLKSPLNYLKIYFTNSWAKKTAVILFMQTLDNTIVFKRNIFGKMKSKIGSGQKPTPFIPKSTEISHLISKQINGKMTSFVGETLFGIPSTAHILGGAVMGADSKSGVIDKNNNVYGYKNMLIIDGSMISANPGLNPALSITAIAEKAMSKIEHKNDSR